MKRSVVHTIDLTKTDRNGAFPCPKCGAVISPADESQDVYTILKTKLKGHSLEKLIIQCKCGSEIHLLGFLMP